MTRTELMEEILIIVLSGAWGHPDIAAVVSGKQFEGDVDDVGFEKGLMSGSWKSGMKGE